MPRKIYQFMQHHIKKLIAGLQRRKPLPSYIDMPDKYRGEIVRILEEWQHDTFTAYDTHWMRTQAITQLRQQTASAPPFADEIAPEKCKKQIAFYKATGILMMSPGEHDNYLDEQVPGLGAAYAKFDRRRPRPLYSTLLEAVDKEWATNVTMIYLQ